MLSNSAVRLSVVGLMAASGVLSAASISGKVLNLDGTPRSNVVVSLSRSTLKATTGSDGVWSLSGSTRIQSGSMTATSTPTRHLRVHDGRILVEWSGRNASGRMLLGTSAAQPLSGHSPARTSAEAPDTLVYSWSGKVFLRDTLSKLEQTGIVRLFDTTWNSSIIFGYLTDPRDENTYRIVRIGKQVWMAENLNYKGSDLDSGYWYRNSPDSGAKYGRLYRWSSIMALSDSCITTYCDSQVQLKHRGICPNGWHVPNQGEWDTLAAVVGGFHTAGTELKSSYFWLRSETDTSTGADRYGFRALPGGYGAGINSEYNSEYSGLFGIWWSATEYNAKAAKKLDMYMNDSNFYPFYNYKRFLYSARCLKD